MLLIILICLLAIGFILYVLLMDSNPMENSEKSAKHPRKQKTAIKVNRLAMNEIYIPEKMPE